MPECPCRDAMFERGPCIAAPGRRCGRARVEEDAPTGETVNHPDHYTSGGIETIDFIQAKLTPDGFRQFCLGNVLKYVSRAGLKGNAKEDLRKAAWYLDKAIASTEG